MSDRDMKPCPFCGGTPSSDSTGPGEYDVTCFDCAAGTIACGPRAEDRASAVAAWNTRTAPDREAIASAVFKAGSYRFMRVSECYPIADAILALSDGEARG